MAKTMSKSRYNKKRCSKYNKKSQKRKQQKGGLCFFGFGDCPDANVKPLTQSNVAAQPNAAAQNGVNGDDNKTNQSNQLNQSNQSDVSSSNENTPILERQPRQENLMNPQPGAAAAQKSSWLWPFSGGKKQNRKRSSSSRRFSSRRIRRS